MGMLTPLAVKIGAISWMPKLLPQITWIDKKIQGATSGNWSILRIAGLPNLMLTVVGRKSGVPRTTPLLCVPYGDDHLIAGSYFGGPKTPVWVANVRAADQVTVSVQGKTHVAVPREIGDDERPAIWAHMVKTWPNFEKYAERTDRKIPLFLLERAS
ncbi:MAG TPA: nitroreductase family deazaflavin-dependent oxidoreductase [Aeromicrobium sp.]|jgi:deazaflavin-dependent oxidoreductase (nitroreductase family)|nr:nitroreductase family deazaflavin-dependent oxidoreductase [Aeromicrobium sp.]HKY57514.1 nitroreductase family deazaflavin-dependent oxidoreductase [Aeromicrobium sp.]